MSDKTMSIILLFILVCAALGLLAVDLFGSRTLSYWDTELISRVCEKRNGVSHVEVTSREMIIYCEDGLIYTNNLQ